MHFNGQAQWQNKSNVFCLFGYLHALFTAQGTIHGSAHLIFTAQGIAGVNVYAPGRDGIPTLIISAHAKKSTLLCLVCRQFAPTGLGAKIKAVEFALVIY